MDSNQTIVNDKIDLKQHDQSDPTLKETKDELTGSDMSYNESSSQSIPCDSSDTDLELKPNSNVNSFSLPDTVTTLEGIGGSKVYIVGTAHFSEKSQNNVIETIRKTQPNVVVLELCKERLNILHLDEKTLLNELNSIGFSTIKDKIKELGIVQGIITILLLSLSSHLTKKLGIVPGGEFKQAFIEAQKVPGCIVHLGDRPVRVTLSRAISSLYFWQKIRLALSIIFNKETITKDEIEKHHDISLVDKMIEDITNEIPQLSKVFISERDAYLTYSLQLASSPIFDINCPNSYKPVTVVGVVGIGHISGIVKNWGKIKDSDIPPLLKLPEPGYGSTVIRKSIKISLLSFIVWASYKYIFLKAFDIFRPRFREIYGLLSFK